MSHQPSKPYDYHAAFADLAATPTPQAQAGDAAFEAWNGALIDAGEIAGNATDERIKRRGERLVAYLKSHRPPQAPARDAGAVAEGPSVADWNTLVGIVHGWEALVRAFVNCGFPKGVQYGPPLWPNPDWTQDQAMIAFALHRAGWDTHPAAASDDAREVRLWDSQWVNVVNHDFAYRDWDTEAAVAHAVKMTEDYIAANVRDGKLPPPRAALSSPDGLRKGEE